MFTELMAREPRTKLNGKVQYRHEPDAQGTAHWVNVSRLGAALRLGRYLRPGRYLQLSFASPFHADRHELITARVMWCRRIPGTVEFQAGLRVLRNGSEAVAVFTALSSPRKGNGFKTGAPECAGVNKHARLGVECSEWTGNRGAREVESEPNAAARLARAV